MNRSECIFNQNDERIVFDVMKNEKKCFWILSLIFETLPTYTQYLTIKIRNFGFMHNTPHNQCTFQIIDSLQITKIVNHENSPLTIRVTLIFNLGEVFNWHSYCPVSVYRTFRIIKPQQFDSMSSVGSVENRLSPVNVIEPDVRICRSDERIHETYK